LLLALSRTWYSSRQALPGEWQVAGAGLQALPGRQVEPRTGAGTPGIPNGNGRM